MPWMQVIDLGSGTGFLGFMASRLGAKHVLLIETGDILKTSRELAKRNGITNCTFIQKHSTEVKDVPWTDVLISETLGNYALEENIIESIEHAKRFLKPGGVIIPGKIRQFVCPVISNRIQKEIDVWDAGFDLVFDEAREISLHNMYVKTMKKEDLLETKDAIRQWDSVDFSKKNLSVREGRQVWKAERGMTVHGLGLWWETELVPGITLSTSPFTAPTHWEQIYLPLLTPVSLKVGESLELYLKSDTRWKVKINLEWTVKHLDSSGKLIREQKMDMRKGYIS